MTYYNQKQKIIFTQHAITRIKERLVKINWDSITDQSILKNEILKTIDNEDNLFLSTTSDGHSSYLFHTSFANTPMNILCKIDSSKEIVVITVKNFKQT